MLGWFKRRASLKSTAMQLYGSSVAQARKETFYRDWGVPDTIEGRFEVIALHLSLLTIRLQLETAGDGTAQKAMEAAAARSRPDPPSQQLARAVLEAFVTDLDDNMREEGIADLKVPPKVKKAAAGLYDRFNDYGVGLAAADGSLEAAIERHFSSAAENKGSAPTVNGVDTAALAAYMREAMELLTEQAAEELQAGVMHFPELPALP